MLPLIRYFVPLVICCAAANANASLIAVYSFDGNANDLSGNGNHGVANGAALTSNGFQGQAYEFRGSSFNDFIQLPFTINPAIFPQITFGAWVNTDIVGSSSGSIAPKAISHDNGGFDRTLGIDFRDGSSSTSDSEWSAFGGGVGVVDSNVAVVVDTWVFLAAVYDQIAQTVTLHVDDLVITQSSATLGPSSLNVTIGKNAGFGSNEHWDGRIDNVFFFDEALTDSQIETIRLDPSSLFPTRPAPEPTTLALVGIGLAGLFRRSSLLRGQSA